MCIDLPLAGISALGTILLENAPYNSRIHLPGLTKLVA
jgi:hypothetical protein